MALPGTCSKSPQRLLGLLGGERQFPIKPVADLKGGTVGISVIAAAPRGRSTCS